MAKEKGRREKFLNAFMSVWEVLKQDKEPSEIIIETYYQALEFATIEEIEKAFGSALIGSPYFPKPVELIEFIRGPEIKIEDEAVKEALKVVSAIKVLGHYETVQFDNPYTTAVIQRGFGGWQQLCGDSKAADTKWFIIDFSKIYKSFKMLDIKNHEPLIGYYESQNKRPGIVHKITDSIFNLSVKEVEQFAIPDQTGTKAENDPQGQPALEAK